MATVEELFAEIPPKELSKLLTETRENYTLYSLNHRDDAVEGNPAEHFYYLGRLIQTMKKLGKRRKKR